MDLSIKEAAPLLGRSERAVRAKILRGELPARRDGRTWRIPLATMPLTADQRESLQQRGDRARQALDAVLPSKAPIDRVHHRRSVADLLPFARGTALLRDLERLEPQDDDCTLAHRMLREALLGLAAAAVEFSPTHRADTLRAVRHDLGRIVGLLRTATTFQPGAAVALADRLEHEVLPPLGGLLRTTERRRTS